jgi:hypothetical protein
VLKFLPELHQQGFECVVEEPLPRFAAKLRHYEFGNRAQKAAYYTLYATKRLVDILRGRHFDVVVVQRDVFPFSLGLFERLLHLVQPTFIYDLDDALYFAPSFASKSLFQCLRPLAKFDYLIRQAKSVVVVNDYLKEHALELNDRVLKIPMTVDHERYATPVAKGSAHGPVTIGWSGTATSLVYLQSLQEPLEWLAEQLPMVLEIVTGARLQFSLGRVPISRRLWSWDTEVEDLKRFDVGVMYMPDDPFARGKFPFKVLQYMAAGLPVVASSTGVLPHIVEHGKTGFLAATVDDWKEYLLLLTRDESLRQDFGAAAKAKVREHFSVARYAPIWATLLRNTANGRPMRADAAKLGRV